MNSFNRKITPSQLLLSAQPIKKEKNSPKQANFYNLFSGKVNTVNTGFLKTSKAAPVKDKIVHPQSNTIFRGKASMSSPQEGQGNVINIFTQKVSCSNFYNTTTSCNESESKRMCKLRCKECITCENCNRCENCQRIIDSKNAPNDQTFLNPPRTRLGKSI